MNDIREILIKLKNNLISIDEAINAIRITTGKLDFATIDINRGIRRGIPEIIYGEWKTAEQIIEIIKVLISNRENAIVTRVSFEKAQAIKKVFPDAIVYDTARIVSVRVKTPTVLDCSVAVISAGTADLPVAEEASVTLIELGCNVKKFYDIGVAGIHRLTDCLEQIRKCYVSIVIAGMEGALPSVVAGLIDKPVIAVPTSKGYGVNLNGIASLLAMLNSCAGGVSVVNIDNGFGAAISAFLICRVILKEKK